MDRDTPSPDGALGWQFACRDPTELNQSSLMSEQIQPGPESPAAAGTPGPVDPTRLFGVPSVKECGAAGLVLAAGAEPVHGYRLQQRLGRGGFGEVWSASGPGGFDVALKFICLADKGAKLEVRALELIKGVRHPHLLSTFGAWQRDGFLILALELADRTLADRLEEAVDQGLPGIPAMELVEYMREAAQGIDHLNAINILHRDIKPANLLLVGGGVKVADFGLAKLLEHSLGVNSGAMTPAYASPEFLGGMTTPFSDQYSLAVTYCDLRGNRLPFAGNLAEVMTGHMMEPPDLTMLPDAERPVLARALAKRGMERWPSCRAFVEALAAAASCPSAPAIEFAKTETYRGPAETPPASVPPQLLPMAQPQPPVPVRPAPVRRSWLRFLAPVVMGVIVAGAVAFWMRPQRPVDAQNSPAPEGFVNSAEMRLEFIPAGNFRMGSPTDEPGRATDEPAREVVIARPFYLGRYEVTQEEYERVAGKTPSFNASGGAWAKLIHGLDTRKFPVENVSWTAAADFCRQLSARPEEQRLGRVYRLPTEAEWEYACRAGTDMPFNTGPTISYRQAHFQFAADEVGVAPDKPPLTDLPDHPMPVGSFSPNKFGLYDMHGNVGEWCSDPFGPPTDGKHVVRGGSYLSSARACRSAARAGESGPQPNVGFRVLCETPAPAPVEPQ